MDEIKSVGRIPSPVTPAAQERPKVEVPAVILDLFTRGQATGEQAPASREVAPPTRARGPRLLGSLPASMRLPPGLLPVPDTRQSTSWSCGASALQAVLMYWGQEHLESELMARLHTDPENGTNPRDILRVAREEGFEADLREHLTLDDLENSMLQGVPVIVACQAWREGADLDKPWSEVWDSGHYMVVLGMDAENVYFEDPSLLGSRGYLPKAEFLERWHDQDDRPYVQSGIFLRGTRPSPPPALIHVD